MKVTQKEFDAKRKELANVQDNLEYKRNSLLALERLIEDNIGEKNVITAKLYLMEVHELATKSWLEDVWIEEDLSVDLEGCKLMRSGKAAPYIDIRFLGRYKHKAYHLDGLYNWSFELDEDGDPVLIPTKKPEVQP